MDRIDDYRRIVRAIIKDYARFKHAHGQIDTEAVMDEERGHYEVVHVGWDGVRRVNGSVIHLDIIGDKIWIQYDGTNRPVADELTRAGVPKGDIVIGFHPAELRKHTVFATGQPQADRSLRLWIQERQMGRGLLEMKHHSHPAAGKRPRRIVPLALLVCIYPHRNQASLRVPHL